MIKIAGEKEILQFFKSAYGKHKQRYLGMYNSHFNNIITDEHLMLLPVDDRTATRAHGVFDVVYLKDYRLINLDQHIQRLHKSASSACIDPPFDHHQTKDIVVDVVSQIVNHHLRNDEGGEKRKIMS